jgi:predicted enzyme related to lactoylglutathione lyase
MPERTEYTPGTPSFVDLASPDPAASQQFYGTLFGWTYDGQDTGDPENPYFMARQGGKDVAGLMRLSADMQAGGMPPVWSMYVTVADVEASVAKAKELGGSVFMEPTDVMDAGRMAVLADPAGAVFCLWQAKEAIGSEIVNEPYAFTWSELITPDPAAVKGFYTGLFGWGANDVPMEGGPDYTLWTVGGPDNGVAGAAAPPMPGMPSFWGIYFAVDDTDAIVEKAKGLGAQVMAEPMDIPEVGRFAMLVDPQGAAFNVIKNAQPGS